MRAELIAAIKALSRDTLGTFSVSDSLPWSSDGTPLSVKNLKVIYVNQSQQDLDPIIDTLDGTGFATETVTTQVTFATDAKQLPANHATLVSAIQALRLDFSSDGYRQRRITTTTELAADVMIVSFDFVFQRTVTN